MKKGPKKEQEPYDGSMPLVNPKHEMFARGLFDGLKQEAAYRRAGYKAHRSTACNLLRTKPNIRIRAQWLKKSRDGELLQTVAFDAVSIFSRLANSIAKAEEAKDYKAAAQMQELMLRSFGYLDHPTLTHEHVHKRQVRLDPPTSQAPNGDGAVDLERTVGSDGEEVFQQFLEGLKQEV